MKLLKIKMLVLSLGGSYSVMAQNMISMTSVHPLADTAGATKQELAIRYPGLRQFNAATYVYGAADFDAKDKEQPFAKGKTKAFRSSAFFNTPAVQLGSNSFSATVFYTYTSMELKDNINYGSAPQVPSITTNKSTIDLALNYSRSDKIFHQPIIYSLIANFISDNLGSVRRFNFNGSFSLPLIRKSNTSLSLGALLLIDPSSPSPVLPIINYYHQFPSSGIEFIVDLPTSINIKKEIFKHAWILAGSNQNSYSTFYDSHEGLLQGKASYNTIEVRSGLAFEYLFARKLILGIGGGVNNTLVSRLFMDGENYKSASITSTNKAAPYASISLSLLPF